MKSQTVPKLIPGTSPVIAKRVGCTTYYVGRVLSGKVKQTGKKAKAIIKVTTEINEFLNQ